jgi:hypothetical protein
VKSVMRVFVVVSALVLAAEPAAAQETPRQNVISANPFGLLLELFNAEYERVVGESSTAGVGGSTFFGDVDDYINADVFFRFYPSARPLEGWAFGVKAGVTSVTDVGTYAGVGFDVNHSWVLGKRDNFYVGVGVGMKRLFGGGDELGLEFIPTIRIINVGIAF